MQLSKWVQVDDNILIEYIYDSDNLISERYAVFFNELTNVPGFASTLSKTKNYIDVVVSDTARVIPKTPVNQLIKLDEINSSYREFSLDITSIQKKDYPASIPIKYDRIRIHMPVNYVFQDRIGCHLRVYTLDYNNRIYIDLSNYFFNITNIDQFNDLQYSNPQFILNGKNWGKYLEIQIPSVDALSDQRRNGAARIGTINHNLTSGVGVSKTAPVFMDFHFIENLNVVNNTRFYRLSERRSLSFPQTPSYELLGVVIEKSTQGDFFLIYPTKNGSLGEFNLFINQSLDEGNRYYVEYDISIVEKNVETYRTKIIQTDDFLEEIEFRPILKFTTTTAVIDVEMNLIDRVDQSRISRKASYGMLQDKVSNYSRYLTRLDMKKIRTTECNFIKDINQPNLSRTQFSVNTELDIETDPYVVFSKSYNVITSDKLGEYQGTIYLANRRATITVTPFDNIFKFNVIEKADTEKFRPLNFNSYTDLKLNFRSDIKILDFALYRDSDQNELERGVVVFKVDEEKYGDIERMYQVNSSSFYITGKIDNNIQIIYTGKFETWQSKGNLSFFESKFNQNQSRISQSLESDESTDLSQIESSRALKNQQLSKERSVNTSQKKNSQFYSSVEKENLTDEEKRRSLVESSLGIWIPYWDSPYQVQLRAYQYKFEKRKYSKPGNMRGFAIKLVDRNILTTLDVNKSTGNFEINTQRDIDLVLGWMKIHGFDPSDDQMLDFMSRYARNDIQRWINNGNSKSNDPKALPSRDLDIGINIPPSEQSKDAISAIIDFDGRQTTRNSPAIETGYQLRSRL